MTGFWVFLAGVAAALMYIQFNDGLIWRAAIDGLIMCFFIAAAIKAKR